MSQGIVLPQCDRCKHLHVDANGRVTLHCDAFPEPGPFIPGEIMGNDFDHHKPYPGDHGIRFEERNGE